MKKRMIIFLSVALFSLSAGDLGANDKNPLIGAADYALVLTPYVSRQITETISLGYLNDTYTEDGCVLTSASDGLVTCLLYNSCSLDQPQVCALVFNARVGLRLHDVAYLASLPFTGQVPFLNQDGQRIFEFLNSWEASLGSQ